MPRQPDRSRVADGPRDATAREWELFRRASVEEPLTHVGSVTAPSAPVAYEQAATLFPEAADLWLCPADETRRYASAALGARAADEPEEVAEAGDA
jgi:rSAM-partnered protein